jgi:signal transduction histidine kinase
MTRPDSDRKLSFFWQGLLILLPVAALAVLGFSAITRDRAAVQQDARRRAHEILAQMSDGLGRAVAAQLTSLDPRAQSWLDYCQSSLAAWPAGESRRAWDAANLLNSQTNLKSWRADFPDLKPEDVFPLRLSFKENGQLEWPIPYDRPPRPPAWLLSLSADQDHAWSTLQQSEYDPARAGDLEGLAARFLATQPPRDAQACAELFRLRQNAAGQKVADNVTNLLTFARRCGSAQSESGVPLSNLALAEVLRCAAETGLTEVLWRWISDEILTRPSVLTPNLLDQVHRLSATNAELAAAAGGLQQLWDSQERLRELADLMRDSGKLNGLATANIWVENDQGRWLCILNPGERVIQGADTNGLPFQVTNRVTEVRVYSRRMVEWAFARALRGSQIGVPDYFAIFAEVEGESLILDPGAPASPGATPDNEVLAETVGVLAQPATLLMENPKTGEPLKTSAEFETLPSKPRFALRLALVNSNLLFAHQRQRQFIFGAVIGLSALAALVGFIASRHAFRRQLRLNELKSNFVSSVSHELRAPIASVRLMAESLERGKVSDPPRQHEYFQFIVQECRRLSALIENVLDFSRIEQGRKQYEFEPTDLVALVRQTVKLMDTYAAEHKVRLELLHPNLQLAACKLQPSIDGRAIQQALVNLIDNAIKHSPNGGTVKIELDAPGATAEAPESISDPLPDSQTAGSHASRFTVHHSGITPPASRLLLSVEDHGDGIPPFEHAKIFERFYRSGSELRRQTQGVGIGLSIVKHIVEAHGGKVLVHSAVSQGSRFTIELPLDADQPKNNE